MSRKCELTGKSIQYGHRVSHSNTKTKHRFLPNLQRKRLWWSEQGRFVTLKISTAALRTVDKIGVDAFMRREGLIN